MLFDNNWLIGLHMPAELLPLSVLWAANVLFVVVLIAAATQSPVKKLLANTPSQHVYFGAMVALLLLWGVKAGISPGLGFHHLGATIFTLMFGWPLAVFGLSTILLLSLFLEHAAVTMQLMAFGINGLLSIVVPVFTSCMILKLSHRYLPDNFFIYIFVVAFFGAGLAVAASRLVSIAVLGLAGVYSDAKLVQESLLMMPLFMFPEAFITGMLISIFVVYKPSWVITFKDERYLIGK